jgi:hypothetical protein
MQVGTSRRDLTPLSPLDQLTYTASSFSKNANKTSYFKADNIRTSGMM